MRHRVRSHEGKRYAYHHLERIDHVHEYQPLRKTTGLFQARLPGFPFIPLSQKTNLALSEEGKAGSTAAQQMERLTYPN